MKTVGLMLVLLASSAAIASDPASELCDRGGATSRADRAMIVVRFHKAIKYQTPALEERQAGCVQRRFAEIEKALTAYCDARRQIGHDLAADELDDLDHRLTSLYFDCEREARKRESELWEEAFPTTCSQLAGALNAFIQLSRGRAEDHRPSICVTEKVDSIAPPIVEMCTSGALSLRAAFVELAERTAQACPEAFPAK
jgi:hypothetical protein